MQEAKNFLKGLLHSGREQKKPDVAVLTPEQVQPVAQAIIKILQPSQSMDVGQTGSRDGALSLEPEDVAKFPGAKQVQVWVIGNRPMVDVVMKNGQILSKEYPPLND